MKIQVNSDKTISVHEGLTHFVEAEVDRVLDRFAAKLTRVEIHLSDIDNQKTGQADKRCLIEVRPAGARPLSASAKATRVNSAVAAALGKMRRELTTFFGRRGWSTAAVEPPVSSANPVVAKKASAEKTTPPKKSGLKKVTSGTKKKAVVKTAATKLSPRGPKKKRIYQARRKPWPTR